MLNLTTEQKIYYILRLAIAMCFIGHGMFGIITKAIWCNYFAVFGIGQTAAYKFMPLVGSIDVLMGVVMLVYPIRAFALWLVIWGLITASLRPLSGEPFAELIERAGNCGAPLVLLLLCGGSKSISGWFKLIKPVDAKLADNYVYIKFSLKAVVCLLLAGHGWLNLLEKQGLINQYQHLGFSNPVQTAHYIGLFEIAAAISVWFDGFNPLLLILFVWKVASELFYPHYELLEFVERGGSYGTLLALCILQQPDSLLKSYNFHKLSISK